MMGAKRKRGCFTAVVALFSTVAVAAILNIWIWRWNARDHEGGGPPIQPERVAVCFFGLTRSLRWTLPSIENRLLRVLRGSGIAVDIFVHTYHLVEVNNDRAGERGIEYHKFKDDFHALNATRSSVTDQDEFDRVWPDPLSLTRYKWDYKEEEVDALIRNVFRAYCSLATVWSLLMQHSMETNIRYDAVVLARPDVWFHFDTELPKLSPPYASVAARATAPPVDRFLIRRPFPLPEKTVYLPSFESDRNGQRVNDRFAYGSMASMAVLMNRISTLTDPKGGKCRGKQIDSEWVLAHHLKQNNIKVQMMEYPVTRVRLTGDIPIFDQERVERACESGDDPMSCTMVELGFKFPIERSQP